MYNALQGDGGLLRPTGRASKPLRIALFSHDTMGLGHIRRNVHLASILLRAFPNSTALLVTGAHQTSRLEARERMDFLVLPSIFKRRDGVYQANKLEVPLDDLIRVRSEVIRAGLLAFKPDVLIVDNVPRGAGGELDKALEALRNQGGTKTVLGLRDVLDDPLRIRSQWAKLRNFEVVDNFYDAVWVYGDRRVYALDEECDFPPKMRRKICYSGYFDRLTHTYSAGAEGTNRVLDLDDDRLVLCMVGGGQDGLELAESVARAPRPAGTNLLILTGPFMPPLARRQLETLATRDSRMRVLEFHPEPRALLERADRVIAMGGYNTISEIVSYPDTRALIVPRVEPRREQLIRAERLSALGLFDMCTPDKLTPEVVGKWLASEKQMPTASRQQLDLDAAARLPLLLRKTLQRPNQGDQPPWLSLQGKPAIGDAGERWDAA